MTGTDLIAHTAIAPVSEFRATDLATLRPSIKNALVNGMAYSVASSTRCIMTEHDDQEKDMLLAAALAPGATACGAAESSRNFTLHRPAANGRSGFSFAGFEPAFRDGSCGGRMSDNLTRAADKVAALLDSDDPAIQIRAARLLFIHTNRLRDSIDVVERMRRLEATVAARIGGVA